MRIILTRYRFPAVSRARGVDFLTLAIYYTGYWLLRTDGLNSVRYYPQIDQKGIPLRGHPVPTFSQICFLRGSRRGAKHCKSRSVGRVPLKPTNKDRTASKCADLWVRDPLRGKDIIRATIVIYCTVLRYTVHSSSPHRRAHARHLSRAAAAVLYSRLPSTVPTLSQSDASHATRRPKRAVLFICLR